MIPQETVQRILDTARIEEVIGDFVTVKRRGADYWACCPFHNEKSPSFHIIPARGQYYCFGCHKGGSAIGFIMDYEHLSYVEALKYLAKKYNIEVVDEEETPEDLMKRQRSESLMLVSEYAGNFFKSQLQAEEGHAVGLAYFHSRGLEDSTIEKYGLGWAPSDRHSFVDAAKSAGYKEEYLLETGLATEYDDKSLHDRFHDRVVFPIHSVSGRVIAFGARTLHTDGKIAKYVNSKESEIYVKNRSLYGIWFAKNDIAKKDKCYLVEGYLDVLSMHQLGICNVVASSGTALTEGQIRMIKRFTDNVTIMYDGDSAGIHAALRGIDLILKEGMNVRVVLIPDGDDPDSYSRKHSLEEVESFLAASEKDFVDFKANMLMESAANDPLQRAEVINQIADTVALIPDGVKRSVYINFLNDKYKIHEGALEDRIARKRGEMHVATPARQDVQPSVQSEAAPEPEKAGLSALENNKIMATAERDLLNFILANGTQPLVFSSDSEYFAGSDEEAPTVFDFIDQALQTDDAEFVNAAYKQVYDTYVELYTAGYSQEEIIKRMMDGEDRTTAYVTSQLCVDESYNLTVKNLRDSLTSKGTWLTQYVPKAILVYQSCRLDNEEDVLKKSLSEADPSAIEGILSEIAQIRKSQKVVKVRLGREK